MIFIFNNMNLIYETISNDYNKHYNLNFFEKYNNNP